MGSSPVPARRRGRHADPGAGLLAALPVPSVGLPVGRGRHGRASHGPAGAALVVATTVGGVLVTGLPTGGTPVAASAASHATPAPAPAVTPVPVQALSAAALERRQLLADRASRSRRLPVTATPFRTPATSAPVTPSAPAAALLPGCQVQAVSTAGLPNGRLPDRLLCDVGSGERLRADAARAFAALTVAYRSRFGSAPCLIDGYRTLGEQQVLRRTKPRFAAPPGTSEHGWGLAIDLGCGVQSRRSAQHVWMQENGPRFGWENPVWAQAGGSRPEPWHWEFRAEQ